MARVVFDEALYTSPADQKLKQTLAEYYNEPERNARLEALCARAIAERENNGWFSTGMLTLTDFITGDPGDPHNLTTSVLTLTRVAAQQPELFAPEDRAVLADTAHDLMDILDRAPYSRVKGAIYGNIADGLEVSQRWEYSHDTRAMLVALCAVLDRHNDQLREVAAPFVLEDEVDISTVPPEQLLADTLAYRLEQGKAAGGLARIGEEFDANLIPRTMAELVEAVARLYSYRGEEPKVSQQAKLSLQPILTEIRKTVEDAVKANNTSEDMQKLAGEILPLLPTVTLSKPQHR